MNCYINEQKLFFLLYQKFMLQSIINNSFNSLQFISNNYNKITKKYN